MPISLDLLENLGGREQEALFARDEDGNLIRKVAATREMFARRITVVIDGIPIDMPAAVPVTDALGNVKNGPDGLPIPRATTIYDAAVQLVRDGKWSQDELNRRIPVLCHQQHLAPVAVCRVCSVHVSKRRKRDGKLAPQDKLVPACQHEIQPDMVVTSRQGGAGNWEATYRSYAHAQKKKELLDERKRKEKDPANKDPLKPDDAIEREANKAADEAVAAMQASLTKYARPVQQAVGVLTELLLTDHHHPEPHRDNRYKNELESVARTTGHMAPQTSSLPDFYIQSGEFGIAEQFKPQLRLPRNPGGEKGRNFPAQLHPKSRPIPLPVAPPPPDAEDVREDPRWVQRDQAEYAEFPYSARTILVDHDRCILCDRCVRACSDVKPFKIIGHTGKGYRTRISFDLDRVMNDSNCVQCGECMVSCPTGALTLKRRVAPRAFADAPKIPKDPNDMLPDPGPDGRSQLLNATDTARVRISYVDEAGKTRTFQPFRSIPYSYLRWNEGSVRRREVEPGEVLCTQGEYGRTAFFIETGTYEVLYRPERAAVEQPGFLARLFGGGRASRDREGAAFDNSLGVVVATIDPTATLVGELACLTARPRAASIRAKTAGVVYEVTRNLLDMAQRSPAARDVLGLIYLRNAVKSCLRKGKLLEGLGGNVLDRVADYLAAKDVPPGGGPPRDRAVLRRVEPGENVVSEGDPASDFYIIRLGTVKITKAVRGREWVLGRQSVDDYLGHIALLADDRRINPLLNEEERAGRRTATVTALDPVEVVRITGDAFRGMCREFPELREKLVGEAVRVLQARQAARAKPVQADRLGDFLNQGLYQGQRMLILDLESCTRCDECTRACADAHGDGVSRLLRDGLRYGQYLVAASCRSCHKPYCMDGCPVDAIHRAEQSLEVLIDSHCIGCSLCEKNCPFGSIQMVVKRDAGAGAQRTAATVLKAVNCDLCNGLVPAGADPFCVSACPHEAAFRWDGETLDKRVAAKAGG